MAAFRNRGFQRNIFEIFDGSDDDSSVSGSGDGDSDIADTNDPIFDVSSVDLDSDDDVNSGSDIDDDNE